MRVFRSSKKRLADLIAEENLEAREYEGLGHTTSGEELRNLCSFLEKVLPE